ncbi:MAG: N-acylglucosamine 2-epimerase [Lentisphaerae bacterium GWF2_52_8]|nr:MAG: N-acylglucosamine 2-epimerase [Lentisphaerae bacterium GWF2_52_8]
MSSLQERKKLLAVYRDGLLNDTIPFWFPRSVDTEHGGFISSLDRDGTIIHTDKSVWFQGRFTWMLATLYNTVEKKAEWLSYAKHGIEFLNKYCFDNDGRMFFSLTREGRPLRKRRYIFSEIFAVIALASYGIATDDDKYKKQALELFKLVLKYLRTPGMLPGKTNSEVRPMKGLVIPMVLLVTAQELRKALPNEPLCQQVIDESISEVERDFMKPEFKCVLECVGPKGEFLDNFDGRTVNPGHSIELGWFILEEARIRGKDRRLIELGAKIVDWCMEIGWDSECGGIYYFRDAKNLPCTEYWHDMKFWWPHNEAIIANLLAYQLTGEEKYLRWHKAVHDWAYAHFPDPLHGEWYGYLHRDGSVSTQLKGNMWKGFFHLPRMQWYCWQRLEEMS